jgi:D-3-phosphoglycerate dehydrogenase
MPIVVWSRRFAAGGSDGDHAAVPIQIAPTPDDVAARADVLSVHVALTPDTRGIVSGRVLDRLRSGSYFINTARGEVVDYDALANVVREKQIRVGLDVYANEPKEAAGEFADPILSMPNVIGTHHIGASTDQAQEAIAAETVRIVATYKDTGRVLNVVNLATKTPATHRLIVRHRDRPGVLAHVFERLRSADLNVQETENIIFDGAEAAVARINLDGAPSDGVLAAIQDGNRDILDLHLVTI